MIYFFFLWKELLLHNVMTVFTFVGSTMVRQDDTYTFNMIYRTLETVIPPLLAVSIVFSSKCLLYTHVVAI